MDGIAMCPKRQKENHYLTKTSYLCIPSCLPSEIYWEIKSSDFATSELNALMQCAEIGHSWRQTLLTTFLFTVIFPQKTANHQKNNVSPMTSWALVLSRHHYRYRFNGSRLGQCTIRCFVPRRNGGNSVCNPDVCSGHTIV